MTGGRRRQGGYSIIESLVVIALVGLVAMAVGNLLPSLGREVGGRMSDEARFEQHLLATRRLRSDLERAAAVRMEDRGLRIDAPGTSLTWRVDGGDLVREARRRGRRRPPDRPAIPSPPGGRPARRRPLDRGDGRRLARPLAPRRSAGGVERNRLRPGGAGGRTMRPRSTRRGAALVWGILVTFAVAIGVASIASTLTDRSRLVRRSEARMRKDSSSGPRSVGAPPARERSRLERHPAGDA